MKSSFPVFALLCLLSLTISISSGRLVVSESIPSSGEISIPSLTSPLHLQGSKIMDSFGREVRLRGFHIYTRHEGEECTQADYNQIASWDLNVVRGICWWTLHLEPYQNQPGVYSEDYLNHVDKHIRMAEKAGIYWIAGIRISFNDAQTPGWWGWGRASYVCTPEGLERYAKCLEWFVQWLEDKNYSNLIGYDPWEFPFHQTSPTSDQTNFYYNNVMPRLAEAIKKHSNKLIFTTPIHESPTELRNIRGDYIEANRNRAVYGFVFYQYQGIRYSGDITQWDYDRQFQQDFLKPALDFKRSNNVPVYVTEFGVRSERQDQVDLLDYKLSLLETNGISWIYWSYSWYEGPNGWSILNYDKTPKTKLVDVLKKYSKG